MRFLKNKIKLAQEALQRKQQKAFTRPIKVPSEQISPSGQDSPIESGTPESKAKRPCAPYSEMISASTFTKPTKNIIINFGKAILTFAMSDLAKEYIDRYFHKEGINIDSFNDFVSEMKPRISGYKNFEAAFWADEEDNEEIVFYKKALKMLGVVFMKYFSVNWIIHGKIAHKLVYLQNRFAILRRITKGQHSLF